MMKQTRRSFLALLSGAAAGSLTGCGGRKGKPAVRVAVIGGMTITGMWQELAKKLSADSSWATELIATGPKAVLVEAFEKGGVDLLTMHSSDEATNLVAR